MSGALQLVNSEMPGARLRFRRPELYERVIARCLMFEMKGAQKVQAFERPLDVRVRRQLGGCDELWELREFRDEVRLTVGHSRPKYSVLA